MQTTPFDVFKVRGANYLEDKVKMDASASALDLLGADLVRTEASAIEHANPTLTLTPTPNPTLTLTLTCRTSRGWT